LSKDPLLAEGAKIDVKRWRFEPRTGAERSFELKCDFEVRVNETGAGGAHTRTGVTESLHVSVVPEAGPTYTNYSSSDEEAGSMCTAGQKSNRRMLPDR
jgi:hypothetical protein